MKIHDNIPNYPTKICTTFSDHKWIGTKAKKCKACKTAKWVLMCQHCGKRLYTKEDRAKTLLKRSTD